MLQVTPHPGYHAHGKYGRMFSKVEGTLWVDKQDFGWIKVDGLQEARAASTSHQLNRAGREEPPLSAHRVRAVYN